jgi:hypothetical protein
MSLIEFRKRLFGLWEEAYDEFEGVPNAPIGFSAWSGATKDILRSLGMRWDSTNETYVFEDARVFRIRFIYPSEPSRWLGDGDQNDDVWEGTKSQAEYIVGRMQRREPQIRFEIVPFR